MISVTLLAVFSRDSKLAVILFALCRYSHNTYNLLSLYSVVKFRVCTCC